MGYFATSIHLHICNTQSNPMRTLVDGVFWLQILIELMDDMLGVTIFLLLSAILHPTPPAPVVRVTVLEELSDA